MMMSSGGFWGLGAWHWKDVQLTLMFSADMPFHRGSVLFAFTFGSHADIFTSFDSGLGKQFPGFPKTTLSPARHLGTRDD